MEPLLLWRRNLTPKLSLNPDAPGCRGPSLVARVSLVRQASNLSRSPCKH